jgi:hypothetical protein
MVSDSLKKHDKFAKWELMSSNNDRRSFAFNHFGKTLTPITMAATIQKSELVFLKYIYTGKAAPIIGLAKAGVMEVIEHLYFYQHLCDILG